MSDEITRWLDESQRLADEAYPGPWGHWPEAGTIEITANNHSKVICNAVRPQGGWGTPIYQSGAEPTAEFIAEARTRLPQAVAALKTVMDLHRSLTRRSRLVSTLRRVRATMALPDRAEKSPPTLGWKETMMTTWDELAMIEAERRDRKDSDWCAFHADELFRQGAVWQREALLSDETVERAARALNKAGWTCVDGAHEPGDYDDCPYCRGTCLNMVRTALTAAIGDQE